RDAARNARSVFRRDGEEEFVVVAAAKSQLEAAEMFGVRAQEPGSGDSLRIQAGSDSAGFAQPGQIAGEPCGEIHHCWYEAFFGEPRAEGETRLRIKMFAESRIAAFDAVLPVSNETQAEFGFSETARDKNGVAMPGAAAEDGAAAPALSNDHHINGNLGAAGGGAPPRRRVLFSADPPADLD